jgi:hypothetical protein
MVIAAYRHGQTVEHKQGRPPQITESTKAHVLTVAGANGALSNAGIADKIDTVKQVDIGSETFVPAHSGIGRAENKLYCVDFTVTSTFLCKTID